MAYGSYAVRYAPTHDKKKWVVEIHKTARAAMKGAREIASGRVGKVCIFDMARWAKKPVCLESGGKRYGKTTHPIVRRVRYTHAPDNIHLPRPGGKLKRLAWGPGRTPIVKYDGFRRRTRGR